MIKKIILVLLFTFSSIVTAEPPQNNQKDFEDIFNQWITFFNKKDLAGTCALFSKNVVADYYGFEQRNYTMICDGFKDAFQQKENRYEYQYKLHHVYQERNLAAVRITWYLKIYDEKNKVISAVQDEGIDVFEKEDNGKWVIVNYLAFEKK